MSSFWRVNRNGPQWLMDARQRIIGYIDTRGVKYQVPQTPVADLEVVTDPDSQTLGGLPAGGTDGQIVVKDGAAPTGASWQNAGTATVNNGDITNVKLANVATATIKGRTTAGTGSPEDLTPTQAKTVLGLAAVIAAGADNLMSGADKTKLDGIASGATANSADGVLLARSNHTGTQLSTTISDFTEASQDVIGAMVTAAGGSYDDSAGTAVFPGSGSAITVQDEGSPLATAATTLNFVGAGVTASGSGGTKTITINGSGLTNTDGLTEGSTNLYSTAARIRAAVLTGIDLATNAAVAATDSVMGGIGKLSARLEALITTVGGKADAANPTITGLTTAAGGQVTPPSAMGANAIDIGLGDNTKTVTGAVTFTWSAAPSTAGQTWGGTFNVTTASIVTFPSFISALSQGSAKTTMYLPVGKWRLIFKYDGANVYEYGEPGTINNFAASTNPAVTDDGTKGYAAGSLWINTAAHSMYFCESGATGAASWKLAGGTGSGDMLAANNLSELSASAATARSNIGAAPLASPTFTGAVTLPGDAASALQAVTLQQLQAAALAVGKRVRVRAATTANITISTALNNADTLDGVTLATGDLVLVKNQTSAQDNGVYVVGVTPVRTPEYDTYNEHPGSLIAVEEGTTNADTLWFCTSNEGGTLNTTAIAFTQFSASGAALTANNLSDLASASTARTNLGVAAATGGTMTTATLAGVTTQPGAIVVTPAAMGANAIDITSMDNTKTVTTAVTYTFSAAPSVDGQAFGLTLNVTTAAIVTFPSVVSMLTQGSARTAFYFPVGVWKVFFSFKSATSATYLLGEPGAVNNYAASTDPTTSSDGTLGYAPGSVWINTTLHKVFFCETSGTGAAVWKLAGATGDLVSTNNLSDVASASTARTNLGAAALASPTFTGTPAAPTASANTNSTQIATTAYADAKVQNALTASTTLAPSVTAVNTGLALKAPVDAPTFTTSVTLPGDAASALQAVTLQQLQAAVLGVGKRSRVRVATTANVTISTAFVTGQVIDGVTLAAGDLILAKNQTTGSQNGVYVASASPARAAEFDTWNEHPGSIIGVYEGTTNGDTIWLCTNNDGGTLNTTSITFTQFTLTGALLTANALSELSGSAATARTNVGAAATAGQTFALAFSIDTVANQDYTIVLRMPVAGTIIETSSKCVSGTATATFKVNTTALGGTANAVSSTQVNTTQSSSNTFAANDLIVVTMSANSSCLGAAFTIKYTRVLA